MAITIGAATFSRLTAQPFAYDEKEVTRGQTAKKLVISGLATPSEWIDLLQVYDDWRDLRIQDEDPSKTFEIGTTVEVIGTGPDGTSWSEDCWFLTSPQGEQSGAYIAVSVEVVKASEALQLLAKETEDEEEPPVNLGTVSVGSGSNIATITLLRPMEGYGESPSLQLTASGKYYVAGPLTVRKIRDIEGTTTADGWQKLRNWYEEEIVKTPTTGTWYPISVPTASEAVNKLVAGIKTIEYKVNIQLAYII